MILNSLQFISQWRCCHKINVVWSPPTNAKDPCSQVHDVWWPVVLWHAGTQQIGRSICPPVRTGYFSPSLRMWHCEHQLVFSESFVYVFSLLCCSCECSSSDVHDAWVCFLPCLIAVSSIYLKVPVYVYGAFLELLIALLYEDTHTTVINSLICLFG